MSDLILSPYELVTSEAAANIRRQAEAAAARFAERDAFQLYRREKARNTINTQDEALKLFKHTCRSFWSRLVTWLAIPKPGSASAMA